jgi:dTDP-4-amino-4,6-dideoxygalactose transaminase
VNAVAAIPFNRIFTSSAELDYMGAAVAGGSVGGDGPYTKRCESLLEEIFPGARVLLTSSCTHALEMSALLLDIQPGDEVIVPSFTFTSTANAFALRGATLRFADVRPDTLNIDAAHVARLISHRTKAIVAVHYAGVACERPALETLAASAGATVIEDNAHGFLGALQGRPLGSFAPLSALSFHESKNLTCGEGGALIINDRAYTERAEIIREKGTDRSRFFRGLVDKYTWTDIGSSYVLSDVLAGFLLGQLEKRTQIQALRLRVWARYANELRGWASANSIQLPYVPPEAAHPAHLFYLIMPAEDARTRFIAHMKANGVGAAFHYLPLHQSQMAERHQWKTTACPVTESISGRLVRLPLYAGLSAAEQDHVIATAMEFSP